MKTIPCFYPLDWPAAKPRTVDRKYGRFGHTSKAYHNRSITLHEAQVRLASEIDKFTARGHQWVVDPDECELRTMMQVRNDGKLRANQKRAPDPGAVLFFPWKDRENVLAIDLYTELPQNIAALAQALSALRMLDRIDGSMLDAALSGINALPSPDMITTPHWRSVFAFKESESPTLADVKKRRNTMMKVAHPDNGGHTNTAANLNRAYQDARAELS